MYTLTFTSGVHTGLVHELNLGTYIFGGANDCDLIALDAGVNPYHLKIIASINGIQIKHVNTKSHLTNNIWVNSKPPHLRGANFDLSSLIDGVTVQAGVHLSKSREIVNDACIFILKLTSPGHTNVVKVTNPRIGFKRVLWILSVFLFPASVYFVYSVNFSHSFAANSLKKTTPTLNLNELRGNSPTLIDESADTKVSQLNLASNDNTLNLILNDTSPSANLADVYNSIKKANIVSKRETIELFSPVELVIVHLPDQAPYFQVLASKTGEMNVTTNDKIVKERTLINQNSNSKQINSKIDRETKLFIGSVYQNHYRVINIHLHTITLLDMRTNLLKTVKINRNSIKKIN